MLANQPGHHPTRRRPPPAAVTCRRRTACTLTTQPTRPDWVVEMVVTLDSAGAGVVVLGGDAAGVKLS